MTAAGAAHGLSPSPGIAAFTALTATYGVRRSSKTVHAVDRVLSQIKVSAPCGRTTGPAASGFAVPGRGRPVGYEAG